MQRLAFLMALPLIGLAGFGLSFWSPNSAHARTQSTPLLIERGVPVNASYARTQTSSSAARRELGEPPTTPERRAHDER